MVDVQTSRSRGVSVVIPAYNYAKYLPKAIDSVLLQDYTDYEIIVVDDGSTDNTAEIVAAYGDKVRYIYKQNAGLPAARNTGIKAAKYDYIGFLDADDEWLPGMLSHAMETFARLPDEFALVACRAVIVDSNSNPLNRKRLVPKTPWEITCRDILLKTQFSPSSVIVKRVVFDTVGMFDESLRSAEDREMWIRITTRYKAMLNGDRLIRSRRHPNNMSKHADRMRQNTRLVLRRAFKNGYVPRTAVFFWLKVFSFNHFETAWMYSDEGRHGKALQQLLVSILLCPCISKPNLLNEPPLFRLRTLVRILRNFASSLTGSRSAVPLKQGS